MSSVVKMRTQRGAQTLPKNVKTIEAVKSKHRRAAYTISGATGLRLVVHPTGRKVWFSVYQLGHGKTLKRRWHEIGEYSSHEEGWTLGKACEENRRVQAELDTTGLEPGAPKKFGEMFNAWLEEHAK